MKTTPLGETFTGVLEFDGGMYNNRSSWLVVNSDNPNVAPGMRCRAMNSRLETLFEGKRKNYSFGTAPNGRLFITGRFKTRMLYGSALTVPHA